MNRITNDRMYMHYLPNRSADSNSDDHRLKRELLEEHAYYYGLFIETRNIIK